MKQIICRRCAGHGRIEKYNHVDSGLCFTCHGSGIEIVDDNETDIIKEVREAKAKEKELASQFKALLDENRIKISNDWYAYIFDITGLENRYNRLLRFIECRKECRERAKIIDINAPDFIDQAEQMYSELDNKYMIEDE